MDSQEHFFSRLSAIDTFPEVLDRSSYTQAPDSWSLIITDVIGSTQAIEAGRYKDVNALGVASIVALRNAMPDVELPFVFGGDGATIIAPSSRAEQFAAALRGIQQMSRDAFGLEMRAGVVPIQELREAGHPVLVGRYRLSSELYLGMLAGRGVSVGETWIKSPQLGPRYAVSQTGKIAADFDGFECRWQPVHSRNGKIVNLLVQASADGARTYKRVIERIDALLAENSGRPVSKERLRLGRLGARYSQETKIRARTATGARTVWYRLRARVQTLIGRYLLRSGRNAGGFDGATYRDEVVANTDYRKFDDTLRMVLDMRPEQLATLEAYLEREQEDGQLAYGLHSSDSAILTCAIDQYVGKHLHFVDGADGGYALAARKMKAQTTPALETTDR